mmetsp:Transcript_37267/g.65023  ORF Transcript_37267/g.65023 Transcript_37267/m.65023 type:complete len:451 (-) Transcript_37267:319-1671(-)
MQARLANERMPATSSCSEAFNQPDALPAGELLWPISDAQKPKILSSVDEFFQTMLFEPQLDRLAVLPDGINLLKQQDGIPQVLRESVAASTNLRSCLQRLTTHATNKFRGRVWHYGTKGKEVEVKSKAKTRCLDEKVAALWKQQEDGAVPHDAPLYLSELRWEEKVPHPIAHDEIVKTATNIDIYDCTPLSRKMPLWERSEGGIFVGERCAGSGLHIDQGLWSDVGRNWCGYKLFAIWPFSERFSVIEEAGKGRMFHLPLIPEDEQLLKRAKSIALLKPGDVFLFSGAQPHTALCVGDGLNVCAFESFVPAHPDAVRTLVRSNIKDMHPKLFWMDHEDLDELYEDVVDNLQRALRDSSEDSELHSRLQACVQAMREHGDAYCRELWRQEDSGERKRRREEDSDAESGSRGGGCGGNCSAGEGSAGEENNPSTDQVPTPKKVRASREPSTC